MHFWKMDLKEFIELTDFLKSCVKGETVKKAKTFSYQEIEQFLNSPMIKNSISKYAQVRSAAAVVVLCCGMRMDEAKR